MSYTLLFLFLIPIAFVLGLITRIPEKKPKELINALRSITKTNQKVLTRPNGQIIGLVTREEPYQDEAWDINRRRLVYFDLDGKERKESRDRINQKREILEDVIAIESDGGIALTQLKNPSGDIQPVLTGTQAKDIKVDSDDINALQNNIHRQQTKFEKIKGNYAELQKKLGGVKRERDRIQEDVEDFRGANSLLERQNDRLRARVRGAEAGRDMLEDEIERLAERQKITQEQADKILKQARSQMDIGREIGAIKEIPAIFRETKEEKPARAKPKKPKEEEEAK